MDECALAMGLFLAGAVSGGATAPALTQAVKCGLDDSEREHRLGHALETNDVGTRDVVVF